MEGLQEEVVALGVRALGGPVATAVSPLVATASAAQVGAPAAALAPEAAAAAAPEAATAAAPEVATGAAVGADIAVLVHGVGIAGAILGMGGFTFSRSDAIAQFGNPWGVHDPGLPLLDLARRRQSAPSPGPVSVATPDPDRASRARG